MKALSVLLLSLVTQSLYANNCVDLSGEYEFPGFGAPDCKINNDSIMHLSPLSLGSVIKANQVIKIKQNGCDTLELVFSDDRYTNTRGIEISKTIDLNSVTISDSKISLRKVKSGTACYTLGCLTTRDMTKWELSLSRNSDLKMNFNHRSAGLMNYIIPVVDVVKSSCVLKRVN